ncbi:hypothetical protein WN944_014600 [Citrus x changshan-huyou]|uniref:Biogenesis of lysosome-related organelles complex 1 subunit 7 n=1 Tax=Citrus x changshan-huyou TaxID=2935761 RepID=A0AAP0M779_9ROSI
MINNLLHHHPAESQYQKKMDEASQNNCNSGEGTTVPVRVSTNPSSSNETPENPQESESDNKSSDALAIALSSMLTAVIKDFDSKAQDTLQSQDQLASAIDRLTGELDQLLEDAPLPFIMQYAAKISGVRKRVSSLNSLLKSIQQRVDIIDRLLSVGLLHGSILQRIHNLILSYNVLYLNSSNLTVINKFNMCSYW